MTIIKYLGLVCIHTFSTFDHIIPEFPNNVVHMRFESDMDILLSNGRSKKARDITSEDDIDDNFLKKYRKNKN
jgi:hypothetical protein